MIARKWQLLPLHKLPIQIVDGDRSAKYPKRDEFQNEGVVFLNSTNIVDNRLSLSECNRISEDKYEAITKGRTRHLDIVMTTRGSIGKVALVKRRIIDRGLINAQMLLLRADAKVIDPTFLFYVTCSDSFQGELHNFASGSAQPQIPITDLRQVSVPVPSLLTQRKIAAILSVYDDLIENNLRRIKILEEMAQNLYREWFIKFRFPGHQHARFIESPLGLIPERWDVTEFRNLFDIKYGKTLPKTKIADVGPYPVYGAGDVIGFYNECLCREKCALVTSRGNGSGTVWRTREVAFVTNNSLIIRPKADFKYWDYSFVELLLKHSNVMEAKTGSAQPQVTIVNLNYVKAMVPERTCVEMFSAFATPICEKVDLHLLRNVTLRRTRDLLLPKLISGEVDVSELDIAIPEEAVA